MDDTQIQISINKHFIERLIYWLIIIVLAALLIMAWLKDDCKADDTQTGSDDTQTAVGTTTNTTAVTPPTPQPTTPAASCVDGVKNGNETGIDCGGSCTKCATGESCKLDADCISAICANSTCVATRPVVLSGKMEIDVKSAITTKAPSGAYKVNGVSYTIKNGLSENMEGFIAKVYIKNTAGTRCYNQQTPGRCDDSYAEFQIGSLKSGGTVTAEHTFSNDEYTTKVGRYIVDDTGGNPTSFNVVVYLYDANGEEINGKAVVDSYQAK